MTGPRTGIHTIAAAVGLLAALTLGLSAGAMLAEGAVLVPWWRSMPAEAFLNWYAANASRLFNFFAPIEITSALFTLAAAALYRYQPAGTGVLFVVAALLGLVILGMFPLYFEQANASFAARTIAPDRLPVELARWAVWHWLRVGIGTAAFAAAVLGVRATRHAKGD